MRAHPKRNSGFTLVELIVASTLMALVLGGVYVTFSTAVRSWRSGEANYQTYEDARRALGLLDRELHGIPSDAIHLVTGTRTSLEFVTMSQPLDVETASSERLLRVQYRYKGDRSGGVLMRTEALVEGPLPGTPIPPSRELPVGLKTGRSHEFEIARGVRALEFSYSWAGPPQPALPGMPPAPVRILTDNRTYLALPEIVSTRLELDDPGNLANNERSVFTLRTTFRGPVSLIPDDLLATVRVR